MMKAGRVRAPRVTHRRVVALVTFLTGVGMLVRPQDWPAERFEVALSVLSIHAWGVLFAGAGLAKVLLMRPWAAGLVAGVLWGWSGCAGWAILHAYLAGEDPPTTPTGWLWILAGGVIMLLPDEPVRRRHAHR